MYYNRFCRFCNRQNANVPACEMCIRDRFYDDQISHASCILLSRTQTASEEKIAAAFAMLREKNPLSLIHI